MMEKHYLTSLFTPGSVIVLAGDPDAPESQTPQARALLDGLKAQKVTGTLQFFDINTSGTLADLAQIRADLAIIVQPNKDLPAALEILAQAQQEGGAGRIYLLRGAGDAATLAEIEQTARCLAANARLAEERLGLVGPSSDWLVASAPRPEVVANRFGMKILELAVDELRAQMERDPAPPAGPEYAAWTGAVRAEA